MEKKNLFYRFKFLIMAILLIPCIFVFSACGKTGEKGEQGIQGIQGVQGEKGDKGDNGKDAEQVNFYQLYLSAKESGEFKGTYLEFIKEYINVVYDNSKVIANKAVASVVSIDAYNGTKKTNPHSGSGVIFSLNDEGSAFIITNYHVTYYSGNTEKAYTNYDIYLYGEIEDNVMHASFVGGSKTYDISVLYIEKSEILKNSNARAVSFSTEDAKLGTSVLAIGNPSGYGLSVSKGIVSKDSEYITMTVAGSSNRYRVLRHDAYITHGSSGGGLFDMSGNLIGITNGGDGSSELINYAIPANIVYNVAKNIIDNCYGKDDYSISKCNLGLTLESQNTETIFDNNTGYVKILDTVVVSNVSILAKNELSNLTQDDQILSLKLTKQHSTVYTKTITRLFDYEEFMLLAGSGDTLEIKYLSAGVEKSITISLVSSDFSQLV